jgi:hypothetical protein
LIFAATLLVSSADTCFATSAAGLILMDYELMGGDSRKAIAIEDQKYGIPVFLPLLVPFHSTEWPFRIDPGQGPALIEQIK